MSREKTNDKIQSGRVEQQHSVTSADAATTLQIPRETADLFPQFSVRKRLVGTFPVGERERGSIRPDLHPVAQDRDKVVVRRRFVFEILLEVHRFNLLQ